MLGGTAASRRRKLVRATVAPPTRTVTVNVNDRSRLQKNSPSFSAWPAPGSATCMDQTGPMPETPW